MPSPSGTKGLVIIEAEPLKPYTTFKIGGPARYFARATSIEEFRGVLDLAAKLSLPLFVLGGGSNILVSDAGFDGVVVHPVCRGITILHEDPETVTLEVNAAEDVGRPWSNMPWSTTGGELKTSPTFPARRGQR